MIYEIQGNLLENISDETTIVHCISRDAKMGIGFALELCKYFTDLRKSTQYNIKEYNRNIGDIAIVNIFNYPENIRIINLITKEYYYDKPTLKTLQKAISTLKNYCYENNIKKLIMPRIGSGYDKLKWQSVKNILINEFKDIDIEIIVYYLK